MSYGDQNALLYNQENVDEGKPTVYDPPPAYIPLQQQQQQPPPVDHGGYYYPGGYHPVPQQQQTTNNTVVVTTQQQQPSTVTYIRNRPSDYIGLSLFACLCCFWPAALVALIYSCQVNDRYNAGDYAGAEESSRNAYTWAKISIIVGIVGLVVLIVLPVIFTVIAIFAGGVTAVSSSSSY